MKYLKVIILLCFSSPFLIFAQEADPILAYKSLEDNNKLNLHFYYPEGGKSLSFPTLVFFFGGGWNGGSVDQFKPHAEFFSKRGLVCVLAEYRVKSKHGTTPFESVMDAKSAMRYLRENAEELKLDPDRIGAAGGSAGGHLAAACATVREFNDPNDNTSISPNPNALILFNPVYDNGPDGYGYERVGGRYSEFSPFHNIHADMPPAIVFFGDNDRLVPVKTAMEFQKKMLNKGIQSRLWIFEGQEHAFFNYKNRPFYQSTVYGAEKFLIDLGWIKGPAIMKPGEGADWTEK